METIKVTFPITISPADIVNIMEGNIKKNTQFECTCEFLYIEDNENVFKISSSDGPSAFYFIGMTASLIMEKLYKQ